MVVKGSARGAPGELALHLLREDTNESVHVLELSSVASLDLPGALGELDAMGAGTRSKRRIYHASINTAIDETLTRDQQKRARERLAEGLGLTGQPYVMVEHVKTGRPHWHVVWSRIDQETGKAIPDSHNYRKHEEASRALEIEFGHQRVQGAHVRDKGAEPRPERGPSWGEQRQAERSGLTPAEAKAIITEAWRRTGTGRAFQQELEAEGFTLARGDRRDFVLVDAAGEIHGLTKRIEGVKAKNVRERMADVDADHLPDVEEAKRRIRLRQQVLEQEASQEFVGTAELLNQADAEKHERPTWSPFEREAGAAVAQLHKTMGNELAGVVLANDRTNADKTLGQVLRESETIEDRWARELAQRKAANLEKAEQRAAAENSPRDLAQEEPEATGRAVEENRGRSWMAQYGGYEALPEPLQAAATRSYAKWAQAKPKLAELYSVAEYINFVQDQEHEREAAKGAEGIEPADIEDVQAIEADAQRLVTLEQQPTPADENQAQPKRTFWQRLFGRRPQLAERAQEPTRPDFRGAKVAEPLPETPLRASCEAERRAEARKPAQEEQHRPSFHLFVRIFGAIIEAYQQALDRHIMERARIEGEKRRAWRDHRNDARTAAPQQVKEPTPAKAEAEQSSKREKRAEALRRLRQQEDREAEERERGPDR